jgi:hypothetical protein
MKTTLDLPDGLVKQVRRVAQQEGATLGALAEEGLQRSREVRRQTVRRQLDFPSYGGSGLTDELRGAPWRRIRDDIASRQDEHADGQLPVAGTSRADTASRACMRRREAKLRDEGSLPPQLPNHRLPPPCCCRRVLRAGRERQQPVQDNENRGPSLASSAADPKLRGNTLDRQISHVRPLARILQSDCADVSLPVHVQNRVLVVGPWFPLSQRCEIRCTTGRHLQNTLVSWPEASVEERVMYCLTVGQENHSRVSASHFLDLRPAPYAPVTLYKFAFRAVDDTLYPLICDHRPIGLAANRPKVSLREVLSVHAPSIGPVTLRSASRGQNR